MDNEANVEGRDARGRFTAGNSGGPGGARRRACELRAAAEEAVSPEHIQAMVRKAMRMALEGDLGAMRFVSERVIGKPSEAPTETAPVGIDLPRIRSAKDCNRAIENVIKGLCMGAIDHDSAKLLISAIQARLKAIEVDEIEDRLNQLEQAAHASRDNHR